MQSALKNRQQFLMHNHFLILNKLRRTNLCVYDVTGKIVSEFQSSANIIHTGKQLRPGIYFLQVLQKNTFVCKQKIVKQ
jgi:type IX secretion system substrate protein